MKTIAKALKDEVHYDLGSGFIENRLLERNLMAEDELTVEVLKSNNFKGAVADCLSSLIQAPNFSDNGYSISLSDKDKIISYVNGIYNSIGETDKIIGEPTIKILK